MRATPGATVVRPQRGLELIDLSGERLGLESAPHVREAAKRALDEGATHYTTRPGLNPLRAAIADKLGRENGIHVHPEREVLVTCGTREALFVALHVLLEKGDHAVVAAPASPLYRDLARTAGATARLAVGDPRDGFAVDPEEVARRVTRRSRVLVLVSPSRPAGQVPGEERLQALTELAISRGLVVVSVETLEPFVFDGAVHRSIGARPGMAERTVTINGFSEAHGLAGWRVGYIAGPEALLAPIIQLKQALSICSPAVSQYAALAAMTGPQDFLPKSRAVVQERRERAFLELERAGIRFVRPAAGYHVLVDARQAGARDRLRGSLREAHLRVGFGHSLGAPGWLSLGLTASSDQLVEGIARLGTVLRAAEGGENHG